MVEVSTHQEWVSAVGAGPLNSRPVLSRSQTWKEASTVQFLNSHGSQIRDEETEAQRGVTQRPGPGGKADSACRRACEEETVTQGLHSH
ncbi:hypothetical protein CapIbe_011730 [Capra ibex]